MPLDEKKIAVIFKAFGDENRIRILRLLRTGEKCGCRLLEELNVSQPTLSHHMKILCDSGIVTSRRVGHWNYYSIHGEGCTYASKLLNAVKDQHMGKILSFVRVLYHLNPAEFLKNAWKSAPNCQTRSAPIYLRIK